MGGTERLYVDVSYIALCKPSTPTGRRRLTKWCEAKWSEISCISVHAIFQCCFTMCEWHRGLDVHVSCIWAQRSAQQWLQLHASEMLWFTASLQYTHMLIHGAIHVTSVVCSVCCHVTIRSLPELLLVCHTSGPVLEVCLLLVPKIDRLSALEFSHCSIVFRVIRFPRMAVRCVVNVWCGGPWICGQHMSRECGVLFFISNTIFISYLHFTCAAISFLFSFLFQYVFVMYYFILCPFGTVKLYSFIAISVGTLTVELFAYILSMTTSFQVLSESVLINFSAIGVTTLLNYE